MNETVIRLNEEFMQLRFAFSKKPLVIGGMAMEYYDMRKSGLDIDLIICNKDYRKLSKMYTENRKDIYGDLGVVIEPFEIWRSIALLDYGFYSSGAVEYEKCKIVSLEKLMLMKFCAMELDKSKNDLMLIKEYYYKNFRNNAFLQEAETHIPSYDKYNGVIIGGKYEDNK